jgi:hypothetical protein
VEHTRYDVPTSDGKLFLKVFSEAFLRIVGEDRYKRLRDGYFATEQSAGTQEFTSFSANLTETFYKVGHRRGRFVDGVVGLRAFLLELLENHDATVVRRLRRVGVDVVSLCAEIESQFAKAEQTLATSTQPSVPASDRVVMLDHNASSYGAAVAALDDALAKFRADHHAFGNERAAEKEAWISALLAGRTLLDQTAVALSTLSALLIDPLRKLWEKYSKEIVNAAVGVALAAALSLVLKLAGLG